MAALPLVKIAGMVVAGGIFGSHSWPKTLGVSAPHVVWAVSPAVLEALIKLPRNAFGGAETEITVTPPNGKTTTWKRVVFVKEEPSEDPLIRYVLLSDVRFYLPRIHVRRTFNRRVPSGATKLLQVSGVPIQVTPITSVITYAPSSLKNGGTAPFNADEILVPVEKLIAKHYDIQFSALNRSRRNYTPNDVLLDAPANVALGQALGAVGGVDIRVNDEGNIELVDGFMGAEKKVVEAAVRYSLEGRGTLRWISMRNVAPRKINVLYNREMEVRGDAWEDATGQARDSGNLPILTNVFEVKDITLPGVIDPDTATAYTAVHGSLIDRDAWLAAVALLNDTLFPRPPITKTVICDQYTGSKLEHVYNEDPLGVAEPSQLWDARLSEIRAHFRTYYRLNRNFATRCVPGSIKAVRAALLDAATATRQPSTVYMDYARRPSQLGQQREKNFGWDVSGIPPNAGQSPGTTKTYGNPTETWPTGMVPLASCTAAPVVATVRDSVNGVFEFHMKADPYGHTSDLVPSLVCDLPTGDVQDVALGVKNKGTSAVVTPYWESARLLYTHRVALVFTATPAGPNNEAQLHEYSVEAVTALIRLGVSVNSVDAQGPAFDIRVQPADGTFAARFEWTDANGSKILQCFSAPDSLEGNLGLTPINDAELNDYSISLASVLMAAYLDHYEGVAEIAFSPGLAPLGSLTDVTHTIEADGTIFTRATCRAVTPAIQPVHLLSTSTRAKLFGNLGAA